MALFEPPRPAGREEFIGSDAATRALSVTVVENDFVAGVYEKIASVYDFTFGPDAPPGARADDSADGHQGRAIACSRLASAPASTPRSIRETAR